MRQRLFVALGAATVAVTALSACGGGSSGGSGGTDQAAQDGKVGVILPDAASSARYETVDRPALQAAFEAAGVEYDIQNAGGDKNKFQSIAEGMLSSGVTVLLIDSLDDASGTATIKKATDAGVPVIDYDRLTLGGGASYYVSFDNVAVGTAMGEALVQCMQDNGDDSGNVVELNGAPTDNNATLFKQGYDQVIVDAGYDVVDSQAVPDWDNQKAGTIFEQIYTQQQGDFVGVAAANDGLAGAVAARLETTSQAGSIPITGQDATDEGLQRVLLGTQCVTIFKDIKNKEATAAADLAVALTQGDTAAADAMATATTADTALGTDVKSVLMDPTPITQDNVQEVIDAGQTTAENICTTDELKQACEEHGVS